MSSTEYESDDETFYGCHHYERKCKIISPCCQKIYNCRLCHNENESHEINRKQISTIICSLCNIQQPVSNLCINCNIQFCKYFCKICNLFDDDLNKKIYHCDKCGFCRIGREETFHCDKCNCCIIKSGEHKCKNNILDVDCPVCLENLFSTPKQVSTLACLHPIHLHCLIECVKLNKIGCPICRKTMLGGEKLEEYKEYMDGVIESLEVDEVMVSVKCYDCGVEGEVRYHPYGMKCLGCGGYNTYKN